MTEQAPIMIDRIEARVFRYPVDTPVRTSFGTMRDRPAVLVIATDRDGTQGFGEIWCNFPSVGAEHRARLLRETVAPLVNGKTFASPADAYARVDRALEVLAIQTGEAGPISQTIAGLDIALWDLAARKAEKPLYELLGGAPVDALPVYASGLNPDAPERLALEKQQEGYSAFKLKVGFGRDLDMRNLAALRATLGADATLMIDANQGWDLETAIAMSEALAEQAPAWLEEPLRADRPEQEWADLAAASPIPLAAGENMRGDEFGRAIAAKHLSVMQPDIAKWGGFSRCVAVGRAARTAGLRLCPHWLGGGTGLVASLHLLAAVGGDGLVEVDANTNPLRELMAAPYPRVDNGLMQMPKGPGLGIAPDLGALREFETVR